MFVIQTSIAFYKLLFQCRYCAWKLDTCTEVIPILDAQILEEHLTHFILCFFAGVSARDQT